MVYARFASGFRAGGSNLFNPDPAVPRAYKPDKTNNYEIGAKGNLIGELLSFDTSIYYIKWNDIQTNLLDSNFLTYTINGNGAKSEGAELTLQSRPVRDLRLAATIAYTDAALTQDFPAGSDAVGLAGDRLPYSSRFSGSLSADSNFPLVGQVQGFVGATVSYTGDRLGSFNTTAQREYYPSYVKADLRAGVNYNSWRYNLYVNNVTDRRGILGGGIGTYPPTAFMLIVPRTAGFSVDKTF